MAGMGLLLLGLLFLGPAPYLLIPSRLWAHAIGLVFIGIGVAGCVIPSLALLKGAVRHLGEVSDVVSGLQGFGQSLGYTIGPLMGSAITESVGFAWCLVIIGGMNMILIVVLFFYSTRDICREVMKDHSPALPNTAASVHGFSSHP
eukprot:TRINITY_DN10808_c0_g2_i4.p1 TRINITY_DN10808_c0_g2~~TRINITY_DN10808_c0_g2_i4.p1  ORF type:complete len:146 (+),score=24.93 TRINITY_DN10808_c0_g2_i4:145-582(+)